MGVFPVHEIAQARHEDRNEWCMPGNRRSVWVAGEGKASGGGKEGNPGTAGSAGKDVLNGAEVVLGIL